MGTKINTTHNTAYKKLFILGLTKGRCSFVTSDFPSENPRTQNRNFPYTIPLCVIRRNQNEI